MPGAIYEGLPAAQLAAFPNSTHLVPYDDLQTFNAGVERFLSMPFKPRIAFPTPWHRPKR